MGTPGTTLSVSISPTRVNLPATQTGIAPYHGLVTLTDQGTTPVKVTLSAEKLSGGCPTSHGAPWVHLDALTVGLAPGIPHHVGYTVDGGASGQAAILASAQTEGKGNLHLSGAVGTRLVAGTSHTACASAPVAPSGHFPWLLAVLPILLAVLAVAAYRHLRSRRARRA